MYSVHHTTKSCIFYIIVQGTRSTHISSLARCSDINVLSALSEGMKRRESGGREEEEGRKEKGREVGWEVEKEECVTF